MMKNAMVSPLEEIEKLYQVFLDFIDSSEFSPYTLAISKMQGLYIQQANDKDSQERILKEELKSRINKIYEPTKLHVSQRNLFEAKVKIYKRRLILMNTLLFLIQLKIGGNIFLLLDNREIPNSCLQSMKEP